MYSPGNARLLAPAALASFVIALIVVAVTSTGGDDPAGPPPPPPSTSTATTSTSTTPAEDSEPEQSQTEGETVTVQSGDTPSAIAEREGIELARLLELNPDVDPTALRTGQTLRIAP